MKRAIQAAVVIVLLTGIGAGYYISLKPTEEAWAAADDLSQARLFGFGPRGAEAEISKDEIRFFTVLDSPKSHLVLRRVYDAGTPAAKAYAIVGLRQCVLGKCDARIDDFRTNGSSFDTISGCIRARTSPATILGAEFDSNFKRYIKQRKEIKEAQQAGGGDGEKPAS